MLCVLNITGQTPFFTVALAWFAVGGLVGAWFTGMIAAAAWIVLRRRRPGAHRAPALPAGSLDERRWLALVEECVALVDELDRQRPSFDPPRSELADHIVCRVQEVLERSGVASITGETSFDRTRHQAARNAPLGTPITQTLSPGFAVGPRILRRAQVRLADPSSPKG